MKTLNVLIVEDDLSLALELELYLIELGYKVINRVDNSADALDEIYTNEADLICMDIDIKGKLSGLEIGQKIDHLGIPIIYITSSSNEKIAATIARLKKASYLIKPIKKFTLRSVIDLILKNNLISKPSKPSSYISDEFLFLKKKDRYIKISFDDILYIQAEGDYSTTHTRTDKFMNHISISKVFEMLPENQFIRPHRSYIVNIKNIDSISLSQNTITIGVANIPISRNKKVNFQEIFKMLK